MWFGQVDRIIDIWIHIRKDRGDFRHLERVGHRGDPDLGLDVAAFLSDAPQALQVEATPVSDRVPPQLHSTHLTIFALLGHVVTSSMGEDSDLSEPVKLYLDYLVAK